MINLSMIQQRQGRVVHGSSRSTGRCEQRAGHLSSRQKSATAKQQPGRSHKAPAAGQQWHGRDGAKLQCQSSTLHVRKINETATPSLSSVRAYQNKPMSIYIYCSIY